MMDTKIFFIKTVEKHIISIEEDIKGVRLNKDIECVHRMRVSLRRLKTTIADFKDTLMVKEYDRVLIYIRKLLKALGNARDIDTKIDCLRLLYAEQEATPYRRGIIEIIDELVEDRQEIQPKIIKTIADIKQKQTFKAVLKLKPSLEDAGVTLDEWMKSRLITRLDRLFHLEPFVKRPHCIKELHRMRMVTKNLRYTLENLEILYGKRVHVFVDAASEVQKALGLVHNYDVWLNLMNNLKDSSGRDIQFHKAVRFLLKTFAVRREESYQDFLRVWSNLKRKKIWARLGFFALDRLPVAKIKI